MTAVNWNVFEQLPGGVERNFEMLCRVLIRRHYGQFGDFRALAAQPGVEFHLKLHSACPLGDPGRWYGWQCRWYILPSGRALGTARRNKIAQAIETTEKVLPGITDWVLWTRHPLAEGDDQWYRNQKTHMRLHSWTAAEVEGLLTGPAEILRGTYFGELVLTPDDLSRLHETAVAPIRRRWLADVHQVIDAERELRRMLCETEDWVILREWSLQLAADASAVEADLGRVTGALAAPTAEVHQLASRMASFLEETYAALEQGDSDLLRQQLANSPGPLGVELEQLPRYLRARRVRAALTVTNAISAIRRARRVLNEVGTCLGTRLVAVFADAGCGKTQLAAQLTAATTDRPPGILLYGRDLSAGDTLDDLAQRVTIQGGAVPTMEALGAAVDAAGRRAGRRLPIVIDGLNEAEDPRDWKSLLASLGKTLKQYPYVLVVCTVRTAFKDEALPPDIPRVEIPDFGRDAVNAIHRYFDYYRIDPIDAEFPFDLLRHPLTLRLFCEVTNPTREHIVGIETMPASLTGLFDRYLNQAAERIAELAPRTHRYYEQDVRRAIYVLGAALWEERTRWIEKTRLRKCLGDEARPWNASILCALEQEGVVIRNPGDVPGVELVSAVFDALAGHLIADSVLSRVGHEGIEAWLKASITAGEFAETLPSRHPLAGDTFRALAGLLPRRHPGQQLWTLLAEPLRTAALRNAAYLESAYLDAQTVNELRTLIAEPPNGSRDLLHRLQQTKGSPPHPLNADFLDDLLRPMAVGQRDFRWTEWVRRNQDDILADLRRIQSRWRGRRERSPADQLRARWVMWLLTSTSREIRDQATRALYWFGRNDPGLLFQLTVDALGINDPYIPERMLAASYGVAMAHQLPDPAFADALKTYLLGLRDSLVGASARHPTSHWLARMYAQGTITLAATYHAVTVPDELNVGKKVPFAAGPKVDPIVKTDPRVAEVGRSLHMDFENYTIGRLFDDRRNYDMDHAGHQAAVAHVLGTVWAIGWRETTHGTVDKELSQYMSRREHPPVERYGKKYGWVGFYTYAGQLDDEGRLPGDGERLSDVDIDPSFPDLPPAAPIHIPSWARPTPRDDRVWIRRGVAKVPNELFYLADIDTHKGPWIAVDGFLKAEGQEPGRRVFGRLQAVLVSAARAQELLDKLNEQVHPARVLPEVPDDYYVFAGEIPWSPEFSAAADSVELEQRYREFVRVVGARPIAVEVLAHRYAFESYHSHLNQAGGTVVPSKVFSSKFDLRGIPQTFAQVRLDGSTAALAFSAPPGFEGHLLYLREDLVYKFAAGRRLIWFIWGERQLSQLPMPIPKWLVRAGQRGADIWREVRKGEELSRRFRPKSVRRKRPTRESAS